MRSRDGWKSRRICDRGADIYEFLASAVEENPPEGRPEGEEPLEWILLDLLERRVRRKLKTVREVALAVGRLGGNMNRKRDGLPGWKTLWLGLRELDTMVLGARLALQGKKRFG